MVKKQTEVGYISWCAALAEASLSLPESTEAFGYPPSTSPSATANSSGSRAAADSVSCRRSCNASNDVARYGKTARTVSTRCMLPLEWNSFNQQTMLYIIAEVASILQKGQCSKKTTKKNVSQLKTLFKKKKLPQLSHRGIGQPFLEGRVALGFLHGFRQPGVADFLATRIRPSSIVLSQNSLFGLKTVSWSLAACPKNWCFFRIFHLQRDAPSWNKLRVSLAHVDLHPYNSTQNIKSVSLESERKFPHQTGLVMHINRAGCSHWVQLSSGMLTANVLWTNQRHLACFAYQ